MTEYSYENLKAATADAIMSGLKAEEVQASMVAQAINFLKVFVEDQNAINMAPSELSGSLKKYADKVQYN